MNTSTRASGSDPVNPHRRRYNRRRAQPQSNTWQCPDCSAVVSDNIREHHSCHTPHDLNPTSDTPLDRFFLSYPSFNYNKLLPPAESFKHLRRQQRWVRDSRESDDAWNEYQSALKDEFKLWYGAEDDLSAWHTLCKAIRIKPLPRTCEACEKAVRRTHVNIIDLIEWGRNGADSGESEVRVFRSIKELIDYTKETQKVFLNNLDKEESNVVLRHLLRRLFNKRQPVAQIPPSSMRA